MIPDSAAGKDGRTRIGVSFLGIAPQMGGFYQYAIGMLEDLLELRDCEVVVFATDADVLAQHGHLTRDTRVVLLERDSAGAAVNGLRLLAAIWNFRSLLEKLKGAFSRIDDERCAVVFHPYWGVGAFVTSTPGICTVADTAPRDQPDLLPFVAKWKLDLIIKAIVSRARLLVVESDWGGRQLEKLYHADPTRIRVLPLKPPAYLFRSSDVPDAEVLSALGVPERYLLLPGRWGHYKNSERVLRAMRQLVGAGVAPPPLVLSGLKEQDIASARAEIERLALDNFIRIVGYVPDDSMACLYRNALALVFPTTLGPTSLPVVEAISLGCPVIIPNIPAYPEQAGDAGIVVDPYNVTSIAEGIRSMIEDDAVRRRVKANAVARSVGLRNTNFAERLKSFITEATTPAQ